MPSYVKGENNIVVSVMSFDPVSPNQTFIEQYDTSIIGKRVENGVFVDVEQLPNDSDLIANDGGGLDE
ncbi:hypothetical protein OHV10_21495 [Vibrio splendidus]|uniref:hypothetical protein n=1 Tax=Vibrio splendidus TaxID=29497 RepID=UPI002236BB97|nr:hypothetical protein [Vibrio splendidus]MCW4446818.1 hypothetical protein [Vibrio splendidus]